MTLGNTTHLQLLQVHERVIMNVLRDREWYWSGFLSN